MPATRRTLNLTLLISALLHALLILILLLKPSTPKPQPIILQLELKEGEAMSTTGPSKNSAPRPGKKLKSKIKLSDLIPKLSLEPSLAPTLKPDQEDQVSQYSSWADSRAYLGLSSNSAPGLTHKQSNFIIALWQAIDNQIADNPFLSEYNHTGQVFVRFEVDSQGNLARGSLHASAQDRVLKVLALRAVREALKNVPEDAHFSHEWTLVNASFSWRSYDECQHLRGSQRNFLSFCHYAENKRKKFSNGERVMHHAKAIYNYGPWAADEIRQYNREERHRNEDFDPFDDLKRDPDWNL